MHSVRLGLYFIAFTTLLLELALIRIFDYLWFPNMAWMIITLAMFSIGVSGVLVALKPVEHQARFLVLLTVVTIAMALACYFILPMLDNVRFDYTSIGERPLAAVLRFTMILAVIALPFLLSGLVISAIFSRFSEQIQSLYFWDLAGAATGSLAIILAVEHYGAPGLLILCAATSLLAVSFFVTSRVASLVLLALAVVVGVKPLVRDNAYEINPHMNKRNFASHWYGGNIERAVWDPVSRIDVIDYRSGIKWIAYDGGTQTSYYYKFDGDFDKLHENFETVRVEQFWGPMVLVSHYLKRDSDQEVLVIGAAGGQETKAALMYGAAHVDAVELVGAVVAMGKDEYANWIGDIYNDPRVNAVRGEGRSFLRSGDRKYDIIQMMSNHTSSSLASGSSAMSPNYLQTVETFKEYFTHLKDDGLLHINHHLYPRMVATAAKAWKELGRGDFRSHILVVESRHLTDNLPTTLISMQPWTPEQVKSAVNFLDYNGGFHAVVHPLDAEKNYLPEEFFSGDLSDALVERVPYRVEAPTDDSPFFNFIRRSLEVEEVNKDKLVSKSTAFLLNKRRQGGFPLDVLHLFVTGAASLLFALIVLGVPLLFSRTGRSRWPGKASFMGYFACLGGGFIVIELVLIQIFMKLVGYPTYTYASVVFSMLLGAGLGSAFSERLGADNLSRLRAPFVIALAVIVVLLAIHPFVFDIALMAPLAVRLAVTALMIVPVGFFLGMPFPIGITLARDKPEGTVAWCWAMNGLFTIIGGLTSVILSVYLGFTVAILAASCLYVVAIVLLGTMFRTSREAAVPS